jgi:hypothetical protein
MAEWGRKQNEKCRMQNEECENRREAAGDGRGRNQGPEALEIKVKQGQTRPNKVKQTTFFKTGAGIRNAEGQRLNENLQPQMDTDKKPNVGLARSRFETGRAERRHRNVCQLDPPTLRFGAVKSGDMSPHSIGATGDP